MTQSNDVSAPFLLQSWTLPLYFFQSLTCFPFLEKQQKIPSNTVKLPSLLRRLTLPFFFDES